MSHRSNVLLGLVIDQYLTTASPVSSNSIFQSKTLSVSSATIRGELARLEDGGFITHKHTSSGRIPCDLGYRHYVKDIMREEPPNFKERFTIEHQMHQVQGNIDRRIAITASVLAGLIKNAVVITKKYQPSALDDIKLFDILPGRILILVVFVDGVVKKQLVDKRTSFIIRMTPSIESLNKLIKNYFFNREANKKMEFVNDSLIMTIQSVISGEEEGIINEEIIIEGATHLMAQPEFETKESMLTTYDALASLKYEPFTIQKTHKKQRVSVSIGEEIPKNQFKNLSVVSTDYKIRDAASGKIMVIGPKRISYQKVIPLVRYVSNLLSN
ncbi:MAG: Transcriptional regulator of heat shock response [Chloroflexi bacterium]|nr:MAG: Transcriptional regulator of heat shock response [Chloroflexota bacterium]